MYICFVFQNTITIPSGFQLPAGTLLMRNEQGQLMLVSTTNQGGSGPHTATKIQTVRVRVNKVRFGGLIMEVLEVNSHILLRSSLVCGIFVIKEGNVLFNDALNTFNLWLYGVTYMVKDHSDSERGNPLPPHRLLFLINSKGSFICIIPQTG